MNLELLKLLFVCFSASALAQYESFNGEFESAPAPEVTAELPHADASDIQNFQAQIAYANNLLQSVIAAFDADYTSRAGELTSTYVDYELVQDTQNPVQSVHYGLIDSDTDALHYAKFGQGFRTAGIDNHSMYGVEVVFKTADQMPSIASSLAGRVLLLLAVAEDGKPIKFDNTTAIDGYRCLLKTQYASSLPSSGFGLDADDYVFSDIDSNALGNPGQNSDVTPSNFFATTHNAEHYGLFSNCDELSVANNAS